MTVYLIQSKATGGNIKIGITQNVERRIGQLGLPGVTVLAELPGDEAVERQLHKRFSHLRIGTDGEWFYPGEELLDFIHGTAKPYNISSAVGQALGKAARALGYISFALLLVGWGPWESICVGAFAFIVICSILWAVVDKIMNFESEAPEEEIKTLEEREAEYRKSLTVLATLDDIETGGMGPVLLFGRKSDTVRLVKSVDRYGYPKTFEHKYFPTALLVVNENRFVNLQTGFQYTDSDREQQEQIQRALKATGSWPVGVIGNEEKSQQEKTEEETHGET